MSLSRREELQQSCAELAQRLEIQRAELQAEILLERLRHGDARRVRQNKSPLGPRKHIDAVKRRVAEEQEAGEMPGTRGAYIIGRVYWLTQEALDEELGRGSARSGVKLAKGPRRPLPANDDADEGALEERILGQMRRKH